MLRQRRKSGNAIAETGPALYLLLIFIFFPMLDFIQIGAAYAIAQTFHDYTLRELSVRSPTDAAAAIAKVRGEFLNNGLFTFIKVQTFGVTEGPTYLTETGSAIGDVSSEASRRTIGRVQIQTTVTVRPYIPIPFLPNPFPFTAKTSRPQEEKGLN